MQSGTFLVITYHSLVPVMYLRVNFEISLLRYFAKWCRSLIINIILVMISQCLKALNNESIRILTKLCNQIYRSGMFPEDLKRSVFVTIPKKPKATDCSDFRTISLMSHATKMIMTILLRRIQSKVAAEVSEEQFGFKQNSGTREAIFTMRNITETYINEQKDIYACFIDYAKAFDRVQHAKIIECLKNINVDYRDIRLITNLYWEQKANVRVEQDMSDEVNIKRGVRQGCVLSPTLFNLYTETIFRYISNMKGVTVGGRNINNLRYADDTVLLAENEADLQNLLNVVREKSTEYGLNMNVKKTKVMVISKKDTIPRAHILLNGQCLDQVNQFTYLGQLITNDGYCDTEIRRRIGIARACFNKMKNVLVSGKINLALRLRLLQCYVWSTLLYGAETWTLRKKNIKQLEAFEMWAYRRIGKISWIEKRKNEEVLEMLCIKRSIMENIKKQRLLYLGHVKRHNSIMKQTLEGISYGSRARGRPRRTWMDNALQWTGLQLSSINSKCRDRKEWRSIAVNLSKGDGT